jgi:hypothetical protein
VTTAIRGHVTRWAVIALVRTAARLPAERPVRERALRASCIVALYAAAYVFWLLRGGGPWRRLGLSSAPVAPRRRWAAAR